MFNLKELNTVKKFYWEPLDKPEDFIPEEYVNFRVVPDGESRRIRQELKIKHKSNYILNPKKNRMEYVPDIDEEVATKFNEACFCYQVESWYLLDQDGNEIPCTDENKLLLYRNSPEFHAWADKKLYQLAIEKGLVEEEEIKN